MPGQCRLRANGSPVRWWLQSNPSAQNLTAHPVLKILLEEARPWSLQPTTPPDRSDCWGGSTLPFPALCPAAPLTSRLGESRARLGPDPNLWSLHPPQRQRFWPTGAGPAVPAEDAPLCPVGQEAWGCDGWAAPEGLREGGRFTPSQAWATGTYWARGANLRTWVWFGVGGDFFVETADRRNVFLTL